MSKTRIVRSWIADKNKMWELMGKPRPHPTWHLELDVSPYGWKLLASVRAPSAEAAKPLLIKKLTAMVNDAET